MKKLCLVREGYYPGDPRVRKEVNSLVKSGWSVYILCLRGENEKKFEHLENVTVNRFSFRHKRSTKFNYLIQYSLFFCFAFIKLSLLSLTNRFSIVQVNTMPDILVFAALLPKLKGVPIILDMHELMPELYMSIFDFESISFMSRCLKFAEKMSVLFSDHIITVNEICRRILNERGVPDKKMTIILNVPDHNIFKASEKQFDSQSRNEFKILSHGSLLKRYGYETLIKAVKILKNEITNISLDIVGDGEYSGSLKKLVSSLKMNKYVRFHGYIPLEKVKHFIENSDICVVPLEKDIYTDIMLPNKLFEYMSLNKPVVSSDVKAIREYFCNGEVVFYNAGDEEHLASVISGMIKNPTKVKVMVSKAREALQRFSWDHHQENYIELINFFVTKP